MIIRTTIKYLLMMLISVPVICRRLDSNQVLDICMDGKHHLSYPVSTQLHGLCKPWESKSCCHNTTTFLSHSDYSSLYNLNYSHCGKISQKCMQSFTISNCFYECSPNVGPWLQEVKSSVRNEKFMYIPICQSDCDSWWEACKDDQTCVDNWAKGFDWTKKTNSCPNGSRCESFSKVFGNATNFCQSIYPTDFKVTSDTSMCMTFNFTGPKNPNAEVARKYAKLKKMSLVTQSVTVTPSEPPTVPVKQRKGSIIVIILIVGMVTCILLIGLVHCWRQCNRSNSNARNICSKCHNWCRENAPSSSIVRHQRAPTDDDVSILQDRDEYEDDDYDIDPRGTLELNL